VRPNFTQTSGFGGQRVLQVAGSTAAARRVVVVRGRLAMTFVSNRVVAPSEQVAPDARKPDDVIRVSWRIGPTPVNGISARTCREM
jgi:hypothetical protein